MAAIGLIAFIERESMSFSVYWMKLRNMKRLTSMEIMLCWLVLRLRLVLCWSRMRRSLVLSLSHGQVGSWQKDGVSRSI